MERVALMYKGLELAKYGGIVDNSAATPRVEPGMIDDPAYHAYRNQIFELFGTGNNQEAVLTCPVGELTRVGKGGDGGKMLCMDYLNSRKGDCIVYSLGSNGQFDFEEDILKVLMLMLIQIGNDLSSCHLQPC